MMHRSRPSLNLELAPSDVPGTVAHHAIRWGFLVILALLTFWLFPLPSGVETPVWNVGEIASEEVIAPFGFSVKKTQAEIDAEAARLAATIRPIYDYRADVVDSVLARTDALFERLASADSPEALVTAAQGFGITREEAVYLRAGDRLAAFHNAVRRLLRRELLRGAAESDLAEAGSPQEVVIRRNGSEGVARRDTVRTLVGLIDSRVTVHPDPNSSVGDIVLVKLLNGLFRPSLVPNQAEYERQRLEVRASVNPVKDSVLPNERIIDANEPVTNRAHERLVALSGEILDRGLAEGSLRGMLGQVLTNVLILAVFWALLQLYRPQIYQTLRQILTLSVIFALVIVAAFGIVRTAGEVPELIPLPFAAMLCTVLFRGRVAMVAAMVLAVLIGTQAVFRGSDGLIVALIGGVAAAVSVRSVRRRNHFLVSGMVVAAAYLLIGLTVELRLDGGWADIGLIGLRGGINAVVSAALVSTLLPVFERMAGITTDLTLLELSDPDRSLLRRLATEASGTYAHSIAMANLCEAACNAIGAQGLLARVGCYYHDIGKLKKPQYFVENQGGGTNPHDKLKPEVSASIVRNHVRDGVQLADEKKLPAVVKAFITEHHGTMEISYFLDRARNRENSQEVRVEDYRYPGPKPQSIETAVAMLADGVEAAVRVLDDATPERLRDAIDHIVNRRIDAGQLDDAPLTMAQLTRVREEFARVIGGVYHNRIDYPAESGGIGSDWEAADDA